MSDWRAGFQTHAVKYAVIVMAVANCAGIYLAHDRLSRPAALLGLGRVLGHQRGEGLGPLCRCTYDRLRRGRFPQLHSRDATAGPALGRPPARARVELAGPGRAAPRLRRGKPGR